MGAQWGLADSLGGGAEHGDAVDSRGPATPHHALGAVPLDAPWRPRPWSWTNRGVHGPWRPRRSKVVSSEARKNEHAARGAERGYGRGGDLHGLRFRLGAASARRAWTCT